MSTSEPNEPRHVNLSMDTSRETPTKHFERLTSDIYHVVGIKPAGLILVFIALCAFEMNQPDRSCVGKSGDSLRLDLAVE